MIKSLEKLGISFNEDSEYQAKTISYYTYLHILNSLSNKDIVTNNIISDVCENYRRKYINFSKEMDYPLGFFRDDVLDLLYYSMPHIKNILNRPNKKIIKFNKMIDVSKLKQIDYQTFKWLGPKPGMTFKEKLSNFTKVKSSSKKYTFNVKENQVVLRTLKTFSDLIEEKNSLIDSSNTLFGSPQSHLNQKRELITFINNAFRKIKDQFSEIDLIDHTTPNNALIGNKNYSAIWRTYRSLKVLENKISDDINNLDTSMINLLQRLIILHFMSLEGFDFIDETQDFLSLHTTVYKQTNETIDMYHFRVENDQLKIIMNHFEVESKKVKKISSINNVFNFSVDNETQKNRGLLITCNFDGNAEKFNFDLLGLKDMINYIIGLLKINNELDVIKQKQYQAVDFISLNSYDNKVYFSESEKQFLHKNSDNSTLIERSKLFYSNGIYFSANSSFNLNYQSYLHSIFSNSNKHSANYVVYDIKDVFDEFSSKNIRQAFQSVFQNSYPVWRSILAGESSNNKETLKYVIDFTGEEVYVTRLKFKNGLFIHEGPEELPETLVNTSELEILNRYLDKYLDKYDIELSLQSKRILIESGLLSDVLEKKNDDHTFFIEGTEFDYNIINICYDQVIFSDSMSILRNGLDETLSYIDKFSDSNTVIVLPNFFDESFKTFSNLKNKNLLQGVKIIQERLFKGEVCWYEKLPDLRLEVIKNGQYETITLVKDKQTKNIIGEKTNIEVNEKMILKKGLEEFNLPLIKSFLGKNNKKIIAKLKDKRFPLKEDLEVSLRLEYQYGNENSYNLVFIDTNKNEKDDYIIEWTEENKDFKIIVPKIIGVDYRESEALETYKSLENDITYHRSFFYKYFVPGARITKISIVDISRFANKLQRLYQYDIQKGNQIINLAIDSGLSERINNYVLKKYKLTYEKDYIGTQFRSAVEELHTILYPTFKEILLKNLYSHPENCYGRIFAHIVDDNEIINHAYKRLYQLVKRGDFKNNRDLMEYIIRLTAATAVNANVFEKLYDNDWNYVYYVFKIIKKALKYYSTNLEKGKSIFYMGNLVDLTIAFLFLRDKLLFENLKPGKSESEELISSLKEFNRNYNEFQKQYEQKDVNSNRQVLKSKYKMKIENKPEDFVNVHDHIYCLILFLSGDEQANMIRIEANN